MRVLPDGETTRALSYAIVSEPSAATGDAIGAHEGAFSFEANQYEVRRLKGAIAAGCAELDAGGSAAGRVVLYRHA